MKQNLPDYIRENENLRQALLAQEGFMKYVAEYVLNGGDDGLSLYAQYQEHIYADYRKANNWNGDAQIMSEDEFRLEALGASNHLVKEFGCRMALERSISDLPNLPEDAAKAATEYYDAYLAYAWRGFFERRNPDHATDIGFYRIFMEQFQHPNGLVYRCMKLALKNHHGEAWTNDDYYDFYRIAEYYYFYFDIKRRTGRLSFDRLRRGVKEWLEGKDDIECRELAIDMLEKVKFFSQHIYNDEAVCGSNSTPFPIEDKRWLRGFVEDFGQKSDTDVIRLFREFLFLLQEVCRIWAARLLRHHNIDLHELEKTCYSFLRPYKPRKDDSYDYLYYVDHYYIEDNPNTCCVKNRVNAKELLYALHKIESGDSPTEATEKVAQSETGDDETFSTRTENIHRDGSDEEEGRKGTPRTLPTADETENAMIKEKYDHFVEVTKQYNFADCPAVKCLNKVNQGKLIWKIVERRDALGAYAIAMLCDLGYDNWMEEVVKNAPGTKKLTKTAIIQHWTDALGLSKRNVAGNYYVIRKKDSTQDKNLYTSHTQTINVHEDYMELKKSSDAAQQKQLQKDTDS